MMQPRWFTGENIIPTQEPIVVDDVCGYVLPHAGTEYTGDIIQHTLRFQPRNLESIRRVYIYYYPANTRPDVTINVNNQTGSLDDSDDNDHRVILSSIHKNKCHHELYVPFRSILHYFRYWRMNIEKIQFIPVNVRAMAAGGGSGSKTMRRGKHTTESRKRVIKYTNDYFFIISADFSHHKPFQYAIPAENKAAHAIVTGSLNSRNGNTTSHDASYLNEIDDVHTFRAFMRQHSNLSFQWIGRTRSPGKGAVGYLSFLIRPVFQPSKIKVAIDGIFVTCYDAEMNARECLGEWFSGGVPSTAGGGSAGAYSVSWSRGFEDDFIRKVKSKAQTESRLTGGKGTNLPITRCVITYLFKDRYQNLSTNHSFIRGWHSIQTDAIYLPDVLLENAMEDGRWITPRDSEWNIATATNHSNNSRNNRFQLTETLQKLDEKAGGQGRDTKTVATLYTTRVCVKKC